MKLLVIGMDGVNKSSFDRGWTPFIKSLIDEGNDLLLKEDLISRGWAEIIFGEHASITGAVYEGPKANHTHQWSDKYKLSDTIGLGSNIKPVWEALNDKGYKVGVMNVPTTYPAPQVDGFFVSGGGGGGPIGQSLTQEQCFPPVIKNELEESGYIVDERLPSLLGEKKLYDPFDFYQQLILMNSKRVESFVSLSRKFDIDFGFLVFRSTVTAETLFLPEEERCRNEMVESDFYKATELFYRDFDKKVESLVREFPSTKILLVSDHSMAIHKYSVNLNEFLSEYGYQKKSGHRSALYSITKSLKHLIPSSIKKILKSNAALKVSYESMVAFDTKESLAFSISFSQGQHGIFINDKDRFLGPVASEEVDVLARKIVKNFNSHPIAKKHSMKAYLAPRNRSNNFPDIVVDLPDGYLTSNLIGKFLSEYKPKVKEFDLREAVKGNFHTIKAHYPLAISFNSEWTVNNLKDENDLRVIYKQILELYN